MSLGQAGMELSELVRPVATARGDIPVPLIRYQRQRYRLPVAYYSVRWSQPYMEGRWPATHFGKGPGALRILYLGPS